MRTETIGEAMNIRTTFDPKPIPDRRFDWCAIDEVTYDGAEDSGRLARAIGYGKTEADAVADLMETIEAAKDNPACLHG
jgi:hypothetical protein